MFRPSLSIALLLCSAAFWVPASAHSMYQAAVLLDFHGTTADAELQLPLERLQNIVQGDPQVTGYILRNFAASLPDGRSFRVEPMGSPHVSSMEGAPYVVARLRLIPPAGATIETFDLLCGVLLDGVPSQVVLVSIRTDWRTSTFANDPQLLGVLHGGERSVRVDRREGNWFRGFESVFKLGMRHIAEGTDHLLFLLVLLFPAPLLVCEAKWVGYSGVRRCLLHVAKVVTAFTAGHSVTLAAGAVDLVHVPGRPIEVLIAVSILVSAVHALRPIFPGREAVIAGAFGLVHGMAFATTLAELGLGRWDRVASIFGFNLGIETMQLLFVLVALPPLILLSRTRLYSSIRITGALFAGAAASAWIAQRSWNLSTPADTLVMALAQRALWIAFGLTLLGLLARSLPALRTTPRSASLKAEHSVSPSQPFIHPLQGNCLESR